MQSSEINQCLHGRAKLRALLLLNCFALDVPGFALLCPQSHTRPAAQVKYRAQHTKSIAASQATSSRAALHM